METAKITGKRIKEYLESGKRFDGRKPYSFRDIVIEKDVSKKAEGSVKVKIGKTEVIVGVKMDVSEPYADSPDKGNLMVTAELLPLSSPRIQLGKPGFESIELGRVIDRCIRESKFIDFEGLCIKKGEKVWTLFVDIYSINDDGNLLDAAGIGAVIALKNAKIPKYNEETGKADYGESSGKKVPLTENTPLSITFHKVGNKFLVDPTREEEDVSETRLTIGSYDGVMSSAQKGENQIMSVEDLGEVLGNLESVYKEVFKKIEKHIK